MKNDIPKQRAIIREVFGEEITDEQFQVNEVKKSDIITKKKLNEIA